jgi:hypothetical protein
MSDNPLHSGHVPPVRQRKPGEVVWSIRVNHVNWSAELKFHGESYGWECQSFRETDFRFGRRFILREEALGFAAAEKQAIEKGDV